MAAPEDDPADALYQLVPEEFVAARDQLAARLRGDGDREEAAAVKKLRKPTVVAWALNQLARRHRDAVAGLVERGRAATEVQGRALAGDEVDLRGAVRARQDAVQQVAKLAEAILAERGAESHQIEVVEALNAAASDDGAAEALLAARLSQPPAASSGLERALSMSASLAPSTRDPARPAKSAAAPARVPRSRPSRRTTSAEAGPDEGQVAADERAAEEQAAADREAAEREAADREAAERAERDRVLSERRAAARAALDAAKEAERVADTSERKVEQLERELRSARSEARRDRARADRARVAADAAADAVHEP